MISSVQQKKRSILKYKYIKTNDGHNEAPRINKNLVMPGLTFHRNFLYFQRNINDIAKTNNSITRLRASKFAEESNNNITI